MLTEREMNTKVCSKCREVKTLDGFSKDKSRKDGHYPQCKACKKEDQAKYYAANPDYNAKYYAANPEEQRERVAKYRADNLDCYAEYQAEYRAANPEKIKDYHAKWCAANPEKNRANKSKRRAAKLQAIPSWLTQEDWQSMDAIYAEAKRLEAEAGLIYHVDHIHPLQGKYVCGLHCPTNLQILTKSENCSKGNRFTPYVEN